MPELATAGSLPIAKISAALFKITEGLAHEIGRNQVQSQTWDRVDWRIAEAVAAMQGVSSVLTSGSASGPDRWQKFLEGQKKHTKGRQLRIELLLHKINALASQQGIALVALKGAELHRLGIYVVGERPMADVDLLARASDVRDVTRLLKECDYEKTFSTRRHDLFESRLTRPSDVTPLGEHIDNPIKIELHTRVQERLPISEIDITRFIFPATARSGLNPYPSTVSLMMHLLLHAAGNMRAHALRLIQLNDVARLATRLKDDDWNELVKVCVSGRRLWWAAAPLTLTNRYYPKIIPSFVIDELALECPFLLRRSLHRQRLTTVSWSNIRIYAFPGIEWARSPAEAVRFALSRIFPSQENRAELKRFNSNYPAAPTVSWYGISQLARALRWAFTKPPRVQALLPIRAALSQDTDSASAK